MVRGLIKYIDIHDTINGHIEIDDRMKPMHDYPRGGEGSRNIEFSYNHYLVEVNYSGGTQQNSYLLVYFLAIGIVETNMKFFPEANSRILGISINGYCKAILSQTPKIFVNSYQKHVRRYSTNQKLL